jgi:hypothetical protein
VNDRELLDRLRSAVADVPHDSTRGPSALAQAYATRRRRRTRLAVGSVACLVLLVPSVVGRLRGTPVETLTIECLGDQLRTGGRAVATSAGVAVAVENRTGDLVRVDVDGHGAYVAPGAATLHLPVPPGRATVTCEAQVGGNQTTALTVTDPNHVYVGDALSCQVTSDRTDVPDTFVTTGDPLQYTEQAMRSTLPADVDFVTTGYPAADRRTIGVRDGHGLIAVVRWYAVPGTSTWFLESRSVCPGVDTAA